MRKGFTLLEMLISIVVLTVGIVALVRMFNVGVFAVVEMEKEAVALNLARAKVEEVKDMSFGDIGDEARAAIFGFSGFEQEVVVSLVDTNLKQVDVTVYWTTKVQELSVTLTTLVANY